MKNPYPILAFCLMALFVLSAQTTTVSSGINTLIFGGQPSLTSGGRLTLPSSSGGFYTRETSSFTAVAGGVYGVDCTAGSVAVTPPSSPVDGEFFVIFDVSRSWLTNAPTVGTSANLFLSTASYTTPAAGPITLSNPGWAPMEYFVWDSSLSAWSLQY